MPALHTARGGRRTSCSADQFRMCHACTIVALAVTFGINSVSMEDIVNHRTHAFLSISRILGGSGGWLFCRDQACCLVAGEFRRIFSWTFISRCFGSVCRFWSAVKRMHRLHWLLHVGRMQQSTNDLVQIRLHGEAFKENRLGS